MVYTYKCKDCNIEFDIVHYGFLDTLNSGVTCPQCHNSSNLVRVFNVISTIYNGLGWANKKGKNSGKG